MITVSDVVLQLIISLILYFIGLKFNHFSQKMNQSSSSQSMNKQESHDKSEEVIQQMMLDVKMNRKVGLEYFNSLICELKAVPTLEVYKQLIICTEGIGNVHEHPLIFKQMGDIANSREFYIFRIKNINHNLFAENLQARIESILQEMNLKCRASIDEEIVCVILSKIAKLNNTTYQLEQFAYYQKLNINIQLKACKNMIYSIRNNFLLITSYKKYKENIENQFEKIMSFVDYCYSKFYVKDQNKSFNILQLYLCLMDLSFKFQNNYIFNYCHQDIKEKGIPVDENLPYQLIMIKKFSAYKQINQCLMIYEELKTKKILINQQILGSIVQACVQNNKLDLALMIIEEQKDKYEISTVIYTSIINAYTKNRNLEKAQQLIQFMKSSSCTSPNLITYNSFLNCCIKCQNYQEMENTYNQIVNNEIEGIRADFITHTTYMRGLLKSQKGNNVKKVIELYEYLKIDHQQQFDDIFYSSLLDGLVFNRRFDKAYEVIIDMKNINYPFSVMNYSIIVKLLLKQKKYEECLELLSDVEKIVTDHNFHKNQSSSRIFQDNKNSIETVFYYVIIHEINSIDNLRFIIEVLQISFKHKIILKEDIYHRMSQKVMNKIDYLKKKKTNDNDEESEFYRNSMLNLANFMNEHKIVMPATLYKKMGKYICNL